MISGGSGNLHWSVGVGDTAGLISGKMVGRRGGGTVEVKESIANRVAERVVDRAATLVPDSALVEDDRVCGDAWVGNTAEKIAEGEEQ